MQVYRLHSATRFGTISLAVIALALLTMVPPGAAPNAGVDTDAGSHPASVRDGILAWFCEPAQAGAHEPRRSVVASVGPNLGVPATPTRGIGNRGGTVFMNGDQSYENGYAWAYGGVEAPDYGAFAERFESTTDVHSVVLDLTQIGGYSGQTSDVFVWSDQNGEPGCVLTMATSAPGSIAFWPSISRHVMPVPLVQTPDVWWAGYLGN